MRETQTHQHSADFGFDRIAVAGAELVFDAVVAVGDGVVFGAGVVEFRHAVGQRFQFRFHGAQIVEHRHALGENAAAGEREAILRKISGGSAFGDGERAVVEGVHAGENLHERGLAGAVAADQADAVAGRDEPVRVFEEEFVAETFSGAGKLNHGLELSSHKSTCRYRLRGKDKSLQPQRARRRKNYDLRPDYVGDGIF